MRDFFFLCINALLFCRKLANSGMHQEAIGREKNYKEGVHENVGMEIKEKS